MGTITDKLNKLAETKSAIKTAIVNKGVAVSDSDTFASYASKIASISGGGGSTPTEGIYGVFIYDTNGNLTKPEEWDTANNDLAVGVAVIDENCAFVIDKVGTSSTYTWGGKGITIYGIMTSTNSYTAILNYAGESNTTKIINQLGSGNAPAAEYCRSRSCTVNGTTLYGYLGAFGEWWTAYNNKSVIDSALSKIGGTALGTEPYLNSTQYSSVNAWNLGWNYGDVDLCPKDSSRSIRAFYHLDYPQINDTAAYHKYKLINRPNLPITTVDFDCLISCTDMSYPRFENIEYNVEGTKLEYLYKNGNCTPVGSITINAENCSRISYLFGENSNDKYSSDDLKVHINTSDKLTSLSNLLCYTGNITISNTSKVTNFNYAFAGITSPELKEIDTSSGTNLNGILYNTSIHLVKITSLSLKSLNTTIGYNYFTGYNTMSNLRYALLKDFGTESGCTSASFIYWKVWGIEDKTVPLSAGARQSLIDTLITYSYDRATAGYSTCTVTLYADTKALLTEDEIAQITAKGYTLA